MAMNFTPANRAEMPDYTNAYLQQEAIKNQIRQAETMRRMMYATGGAQAAEQVPYAKWADFGNAIMGNSPAAPAASSALIQPTTGAVASAAPEVIGGLGMTGEAAAAAEAAMAAEAAAGGTGAGSALAALGPMGWLALLGFGLAATDAL